MSRADRQTAIDELADLGVERYESRIADQVDQIAAELQTVRPDRLRRAVTRLPAQVSEHHIYNATHELAACFLLRDGLEFWEEFLALHPEQHGWMYNNAAFTARDLATAIEKEAENADEAERKAKTDEAMKIYELSYELRV